MSPPDSPRSDLPVLPRGLIFLASLWLVGSWLVAIGVNPPVQPSSASYTPGVRLLLDCILVGVIVAWPMMRFSQPRCPWPMQRGALDALVLLGLLHIVLWPMRLVTPWSVERTLAIDVVLAGWTALVGAMVALGGGLDRPGRTLAMSAVLLLALLGPAVATIAKPLGASADSGALLSLLSPFTALRTLSGGGPAALTIGEWMAAASGPLLASLVWLGAGLFALGRRHRLSRPPDDSAGLPPQEPLCSPRHV
jgi:hypothetical protein